MKRLLPLLLLAGCYAHPYYYGPGYYGGPGYYRGGLPAEAATRIAFDYARSQGLNAVGVQNTTFGSAGNVWDVTLSLGAPSCGFDRILVDRWNGRVLQAFPSVAPCGAPPPMAPPPAAGPPPPGTP